MFKRDGFTASDGQTLKNSGRNALFKDTQLTDIMENHE